MKSSRIHIVEDEPLVAMDIEATLEKLEYNVTGIDRSGEECLHRIPQLNPDLILMDIMLGGKIDGIETAGEIRRIYGIPVIFLTAYSDNSYLKRAKITEPYGYILKPTNDRDLHSAIEISLYRHTLDIKLKKSEDKYRNLFNNAQVGLYRSRIGDGRLLECNDLVAAMLGYDTREECLADYTASNHYVNIEDREPIRERMEKNGWIGNYEVPLRRKDNTVFWASFSARVYPDEDCIEGAAIDITEGKQARDKIDQLNTLLSTILDVNKCIAYRENIEILLKDICMILAKTGTNSFAWIGLLDESGVFNKVSESGLDGTLSETLIGNEAPFCVKKELTPEGIAIINERDSICIECSVSDKLKTDICKCLIRLEYHNKIYGILATGMDTDSISGKETQYLLKELADDIAFALYSIEMEEERERLQNQLIHSEKLSAVGQLAAGVAHEFNNILNVITGHTQLSSYLDSIDEIRESIQVIDVASKRACKLLKNLNDFAKPERPEFIIQDISGVIDEVLILQEKQLQQNNIEIKKEYLNHSPVLFDWGQIEQVIMNLIINAAQAIPSSIDGIIKIVLLDVDNHVEIRVSDNGIGMDEDIQKRIFEPFFTTKKSASMDNSKVSGSGLGLSVSYSIIKQHKGHIRVESVKGKGTTFIITLPTAGTETA